LTTALICGVSGQDGAYLAQLLLSKGYSVHGASRDAQTSAFSSLKRLGIFNDIRRESTTITDFRSVLPPITRLDPHETSNLAGPTSPGPSFEHPAEPLAQLPREGEIVGAHGGARVEQAAPPEPDCEIARLAQPLVVELVLDGVHEVPHQPQ